jgi:hypothetical protein
MSVAILGTDGNPFSGRPGDIDASPNGIILVCGQFGLTGNYVTGGDPIDFTKLLDWVPGTAIRQCVAWSQNGNLLFQYVPVGSRKTALNAWLLKVSASGTFGSEHAAAGYEASILADIVMFQAIYDKLL